MAKRGLNIVGVDISPRMLSIAEEKNEKANLKVKFLNGDMRSSKVGQFDAAITIGNAIGHLTREDFKKLFDLKSTEEKKIDEEYIQFIIKAIEARRELGMSDQEIAKAMGII